MAATLLGAAPASAQLLVSKRGVVAPDRATAIVARDGERTTVVLELDPDGKLEPSEELALVVGPAVGASSIRRLGRRYAPRLEGVARAAVVELWERDPCELHPIAEPPPTKQVELAALGEPARAEPSSALRVISAKELEAAGYVAPEVAPAFLEGALAIVGLSVESLRAGAIAFDAPSGSIGTRLFAAGAAGRPLTIFTIAREGRLEASTSNLALPTNLDVEGKVARSPEAFVRSLEARVLAERADSVLTTYAWRASDCERCDAPIGAGDVLALVPSEGALAKGAFAEVLVDASVVSPTEPMGSDDLRGALQACYRAALALQPGFGGAIRATITGEGDASTARIDEVPEPMRACVQAALDEEAFERAGELRATLAPIGRQAYGELTVTRLVARFASPPADDLVLRPGRAIEGGREIGASGELERKVAWGEGANNFQGRFLVKHPWKKPIPCTAPLRGIYREGPPAPRVPDATPTTSASPPTPTASASVPAPSSSAATPAKSAAKIDLGDAYKLVRGGAPNLDDFVIAHEAPPPASPPPPMPSAAPSPAVVPAAASATPGAGSGAPAPPGPSSPSGCACVVGSDTGAFERGAVAGWLFGLSAIVVGVRRRAARAARRA